MMLAKCLTLLLLATTAAFSQESVSFTVGQQELSFLHQAGDGATLVVLPPAPEAAAAEAKNWAPIAASRKWRMVMPQFPFLADTGVRNFDAMVKEVRRRYNMERAPFYLVGSGPAAAMAVYAAARAPHLWAAALLIGGSAKPAIDSDRIFAANTALVPVAWAMNEQERVESAALRQRMTTVGFNLRVLESPTVGQALDFLSKQLYDPMPRKIDCETGNPTLSQCYWIRMTGFDPALRNDALLSSRVNPDSPASLDLGGFGYSTTKPGPGVVVEWLPPGYKGQLMLNDRITQLSTRNILDPKHYVEMMSQVTEERPVTITVERQAKKETERIRLTTRYVLRKREEVVTARLQAEFSPDAKEIVIVSRTVAALEVSIPPEWVPATVNWNGNQMANAQNPGCLALSLKEPGSARPCSLNR